MIDVVRAIGFLHSLSHWYVKYEEYSTYLMKSQQYVCYQNDHSGQF